MPEVPPVIQRDKSSIRDVVGPTPDSAKGETNEGEALLEEVEGQAQAAAALKKMRRVKEKSPIQTDPLKRKKSESASPA